MIYEWEYTKGKYKLYIPELRCTLIVFEKEGWHGLGKFDYAKDRKTFLLDEVSNTPNESKNLLVTHLLTGLFECQKNLMSTLTTPFKEFT